MELRAGCKSSEGTLAKAAGRHVPGHAWPCPPLPAFSCFCRFSIYQLPLEGEAGSGHAAWVTMLRGCARAELMQQGPQCSGTAQVLCMICNSCIEGHDAPGGGITLFSTVHATDLGGAAMHTLVPAQQRTAHLWMAVCIQLCRPCSTAGVCWKGRTVHMHAPHGAHALSLSRCSPCARLTRPSPYPCLVAAHVRARQGPYVIAVLLSARALVCWPLL